MVELGNKAYLNFRRTDLNEYIARVEMTDATGRFRRFHMNNFKVLDNNTNYKLEISGFSASEGAWDLADEWSATSNGAEFSFPPVEDNDGSASVQCISEFGPGW